MPVLPYTRTTRVATHPVTIGLTPDILDRPSLDSPRSRSRRFKIDPDAGPRRRHGHLRGRREKTRIRVLAEGSRYFCDEVYSKRRAISTCGLKANGYP